VPRNRIPLRDSKHRTVPTKARGLQVESDRSGVNVAHVILSVEAVEERAAWLSGNTEEA
jgi:hypothetical protein